MKLLLRLLNHILGCRSQEHTWVYSWKQVERPTFPNPYVYLHWRRCCKCRESERAPDLRERTKPEDAFQRHQMGGKVAHDV
mgnify:CR=1 FL=1